ncbi:MAG: FAD-dependent tricarballylate dehydrogenase TcuA [Halobacteriota archaeon]
MTTSTTYEVVVVGCGIAGLAAANRAAELGRDVAVLEKAPKEHRGGHTRYSESFRVPSADADLEQFGYEFAVPDYSADDFYEDIMKQTNAKADPDLARTLVDNAGETVEWLTARGVSWDMEPLNVGYTVARTFFDGEELVSALVEAAEADGATFHYRTEARELLVDDDGAVAGVTARTDDGLVEFHADTVIVGAGGYESSEEKRTQYYGSDYDAMKVRGSRYNTGEAIEMLLDVGANGTGQWGGAHMALIDRNAPPVEGGANRVDGYQYGVLINNDGERFFDEGEDARAHTYAKLGRIIFEEPGHEAFIVIDAPLKEHMRATGPSDPVVGDTVEAVLSELGCDNPAAGAATIEQFNAACDPGEFDPDTLDGNRTTGLDLEKTNWALPIDEPPFYGYAVTGGITFGFGGVKTDTRARVVDTIGRPIENLYVAGNTTGGLFFDNYPGGTGLSNAAVYGKIAAEEADKLLSGGET